MFSQIDDNLGLSHWVIGNEITAATDVYVTIHPKSKQVCIPHVGAYM